MAKHKAYTDRRLDVSETSIGVSREIRDTLKKLKGKHRSYNELFAEMIKQYDPEQDENYYQRERSETDE